jgi:hypothetical protein
MPLIVSWLGEIGAIAGVSGKVYNLRKYKQVQKYRVL